PWAGSPHVRTPKETPSGSGRTIPTRGRTDPRPVHVRLEGAGSRMEAEMRAARITRSLAVGVAILAMVAARMGPALAGSEAVAYSFGGDEDGEYPSTDL